MNAQNAESIYVLKNENQKLKDKINELQLECEQSNELRRKQMSEHSMNSNERDVLCERVNLLMEVSMITRIFIRLISVKPRFFISNFKYIKSRDDKVWLMRKLKRFKIFFVKKYHEYIWGILSFKLILLNRSSYLIMVFWN